MSALAKKWVMLAKKGNATALSSILERLYPVLKEQAHSNPIVHMGIRLELSDGQVRDVGFALQAGEESQMDQAQQALEAPEVLDQAESAEGSEGSEGLVGVPKIDRNPS